MNEFKINDVVILNSGGPDMVVTEQITPNEDYVSCEWFNNNGEKQRSDFHYLTLTKKQPKGGFKARLI